MTHHTAPRHRAGIPAPAGTLRALRESAGLTQAQAAGLADVTLRQWQRYERGDSLPRGRRELFASKVADGGAWQSWLESVDTRAPEDRLPPVELVPPERREPKLFQRLRGIRRPNRVLVTRKYLAETL